MNYHTFPPGPALAPFVECFWTLSREAEESPGVERIVPDGCPELIFNLHTPFVRVATDGRRAALPPALLAGQLSQCLVLAPAGAVDIVAARFTPAGAAEIFPFSLHEITDAHVPLAAMERRWRELEARLREMPARAARLRCLEAALLAARRAAPVARTRAAIARLRAACGCLGVAELAAGLAVTPRQLERDFARDVGLGPKAFARIERFRHARAALARGGARWADVAAACGYSDQAHLANDFRALAGVAPRDYFRGETPLAAAIAG